MSEKIKVCAIDLGASNGRSIIGEYDGKKIELREISRFENGPENRDGTLYWNFGALKKHVTESASMAAAEGVASVGIDTWGVDYAYLMPDGTLAADPVNYRNPAITGLGAEFHKKMSFETLYGITGIQSLDFNTVYRLAEDAQKGRIPAGAKAMMIPDLLNFYLSGERACEYTDASTGALLDARTRDFSPEVLSAAGLERSLFCGLVFPGNRLGTLLPSVSSRPVSLINVGSHDTASAVIAVPTDRGPGDFVYISSGTWSLMGTELTAPLSTEACCRLNFTNEGGAYGTLRFLKNIMGLWLRQESRRCWKSRGITVGYDDMEAAAAEVEPFRSVIDPNSPEFTAPGDMPGRIAEFCRRTGQPVPETVGEIVRTIYDSLALCYRYTCGCIAGLTGKKPSCINIVGGGSKDETLNRLTADVTGLPVVAGPSEGTAIGNMAVQLISLGELSGLSEARELIAGSFPLKRYEPAADRSVYDRAYEKYLCLTEK